MTVRQPYGKEDVISRARIRKTQSQKQSLMPEGLESGLTPQDFADLLEFIVSFSDEQCGVTRHPMSDTWPLQVLSTVRFEDLGRRTRVIMTASPIGATEAERRTFIENKGSMVQGWNGTAEQLDAYLKTA